MKTADTLVSVVTVTRNDAQHVEAFVRELSMVLEGMFRYYEIVIVDDGSLDDTVEVVENLQRTIKNVQLYCLPRSSGDQVALVAGLENAIGDYVVTLDLWRDPIPPIAQMMEVAISQELDIVYGLPGERVRPASLYARFSTRFFSSLCRLSDLDIPPAITNYRLMSRRVVNYVLEISDVHRTLLVAPALSGFGYGTVPYERSACLPPSRGRRRGALEPFWQAIDLVVSTSMRPLRAVTVLSLLFGGVSFLYGIVALLLKYVFLVEEVAPGWTSLSLQISGLFLLVFLSLAIMSEYLLRMSEITNRRPSYHFKGESCSTVMDYEQEPNVDRTPRMPEQ